MFRKKGVRPATLLKKRLWYSCFPVNFVKFLGTSFFIEHIWWLLLTGHLHGEKGTFTFFTKLFDKERRALIRAVHCVKSVQIRSSSPYFPAFGLNTERYEVPFRIQPDCVKIRTRKNSVFGHFSSSSYNSL